MGKKFVFLTVILSKLLFSDAVLDIPYGLNNMISEKTYDIKIGFTSYQEISNQGENWIGIFKEGVPTKWKNVIVWSWIKNLNFDNESQSYIFDISNLKDGKYEVRFFYNNSYNIATSKKFSVSHAKDFIKPTYDANSDSIQIISSNYSKKSRAWIGIYDINATSNLKNVLAWAWQKDSKKIDPDGVYEEYFEDLKLKDGNYEARLFFNDSFSPKATSRFQIKSDK